MATIWLRRVVLAAFIVLAFVPASAFAATMDYLGAWSSSTTYATGKVVKHNGGIFYSLKSTNSAPNRNKPPSENPAWWELVGSAVKPRAVYDVTGKYVGPLVSGDANGNSAFVGFNAGGFLAPVSVLTWGFVVCNESAAVCVPSAQNNYGGSKVYTTTDCSGTAYYWSNELSGNFARTYGVASSSSGNSPVALSFDIYYPTNETKRTIASYYVGQIEGCKRMNYQNFVPTPSADLIVNDGTFTKVTISGFTAPFYIK
jgi:hypothetical protein